MLKPSWMSWEDWVEYRKIHPIFVCSQEGCGETDPTEETVDHIIPRANGGTNDLSNLQPMCRRHNSMKGPRDDSYWSMPRLFRQRHFA